MKNRGVTLIALIITIIILLILAGISLTALVGDNGILTRAASVEEEYSKGELEEQLTMLINEKLVDAYEKINQNTETSEDISTQFNEEILINYLTDPNSDGSDDDAYIEIEYNAEVISPVKTAEDESFVLYDAYYIYATRIASSLDTIGIGENDGTLKNVFILEAITEETSDENGNTTTKSTGEYNLVYYNSESVSSILTTILLYTTNNS